MLPHEIRMAVAVEIPDPLDSPFGVATVDGSCITGIHEAVHPPDGDRPIRMLPQEIGLTVAGEIGSPDHFPLRCAVEERRIFARGRDPIHQPGDDPTCWIL